MRLAATISTVRTADRRAVALAATLRATAETPNDAAIVDLSETGFLAELPDDVVIEPGATIRVAAQPIGAHLAVAVRREGARHGFAFVRPLAPALLAALDRPAAPVVVRFPGAPLAAALPGQAPSARMSLLMMTGLALSLWMALGVLLIVTRHLV